MRNEGFTRNERRELRQLAAEAYRRELDVPLRDLASAFRDWERGRIDPVQLCDLLHEFHDGDCRRIWGTHQRLKPEQSVARAVAMDVLRRTELSPAILTRLDRTIAAFRELIAASDSD